MQSKCISINNIKTTAVILIQKCQSRKKLTRIHENDLQVQTINCAQLKSKRRRHLKYCQTNNRNYTHMKLEKPFRKQVISWKNVFAELSLLFIQKRAFLRKAYEQYYISRNIRNDSFTCHQSKKLISQKVSRHRRKNTQKYRKYLRQQIKFRTKQLYNEEKIYSFQLK